MTDPRHIPVIAASGEIIDRPGDLERALEPVALMAEALRVANAGGRLLDRVDSLDVVNQISWPYARPVDLLCDRLGISPRRRQYGMVGGETPLMFIQQAAARIAAGRAAVAAICGGEAHQSVASAQRRGRALPWTPVPPDPVRSIRGQDTASRAGRRLGIHLPVTVYPLFENAQLARWGQPPREALTESGRMWAGLSQVAAENPMLRSSDLLRPRRSARPRHPTGRSPSHILS